MHAGWCALCRHSLDALSKGRAGASLWPGSQPPDPVVHLRRAPLRCDASSSASASGDVNDRQPRSFARLKAVQSQTDVQAAPRQTLPRRRRNSRGVPAPPIDEDEDSGNGEEDVEVFNLQTGWSADALKEGLGAWSVTQTRAEGSSSSTAAATVGDLDDLEGDDGRTSWSTSNFAADDDDDDDGWSIGPETDDAAGDGSWSVAVDEGEDDGVNDLDDLDDDGERPAKVAAERALLSTIPDHVMRELERHEAEAKVEAEKLKPANLRAEAKARRLHRQLRIISGSAAGRRLLSAQGKQTRPMMETVRGAVFDILQSQLGCGGRLPETSRWLDLFAGTGAVGIEGLSRGCREAHFVELDPRVARSVLEPNLEACDMTRAASVHVMRAEEFLKAALRSDRFAGGAFDFISVCPPYELVDYVELYDLLEASPLVKETTMIVIEYPKRLASLVRDRTGPLVKVRDRKYGRTMVAVYGPDTGEDEDVGP